MAKSIIEQLMALLSPEERTALQAKLDANPRLLVDDRKMSELFSIYLGDEDLTTATSTAANDAAAKAAKDAEAARATEAARVAAEAGKTTLPGTLPGTVTGGDSAILAKLTEISTSLDTKIEALKKEFVPVSKLGDYRTDMLASAIKASDDYAQVRESHRAEFGEPLDRNAFEKFVTEQRAAGVGYKDMAAAHDAFVAEKRVAKKIADGVTEGVKTKLSGTQVPGSTQSVGLSPAQQIIAKQKEAAKGADGGKSNAMAAAERLAQLRKEREDRQVQVQ